MTDKDKAGASRREFLTMAAGATAAMAAIGTQSPVLAQSAAPAAPAAPALAKNLRARPNMIFLFGDQERYRSKWPAGLSLPAHERLARTGVTFHNHFTPAVMCTSSRAVMVTGLQTADNRMYENVDAPYVRDLSTKIPTIGHMLRKAGYYTAYKGKWHLSRKFDVETPETYLTKEMDDYGFSDFYSPGDVIGHTLGGYHFDHLIAGSAITWLRRKGRAMTEAGQPWCLFVSLVNPHDVMYFNTDAPGEKRQDTGNLFMHAARAPDIDLYKAEWDEPLPTTLREPLDAKGRPQAHAEFSKMWAYQLGEVPMEEANWRRFTNFYTNCIRSVDAQVTSILNELDTQKLTDSTAFIYTSDHGELAGAHGLRGKGPFAYHEGTHVPFYMVHPDVAGGQDCRALTSHIDVVPTLLAMAGVPDGDQARVAKRDLPGKDLTPLLTSPGSADMHAAREAILFTYSGLATTDSTIFKLLAEAKAAGKNPAMALVKQGFVPDLKKRGGVRSVYDGRYKFTRYFAPVDRNEPKTVEDLFKWNDVELFDIEADPSETVNLALDRTANEKLIAEMNAKLNVILAREFGADDGRELPNLPTVKWGIDVVS